MTTEPESEDGSSRWEELLLAESCGEITAAQRSELERLAERSELRRREREVLAAVGSLVPLVREQSAKDRQLINSVLAQHGRRRSRRRRGRAIGVAMAFLPLSAAAAYWVGRSDPADSVPSGSAPPLVVPAVRAIPPTTSSAPPMVRPAPIEARPAQTTPGAATVTSALPSAAELLSRAQAARSVRNYSGAMKLYRDIARLYPKSTEAHLSRLSLAQLELVQGNPAQALAGFEAYERLGGPLMQEAEYGRIQALGALGRTEEERAAIRRFVAQHPNSLQAATLRRRLGAESATE
jgi:tetratricopeptide (TPR) repeat protein